jgi:hypothetical protein
MKSTDWIQQSSSVLVTLLRIRVIMRPAGNSSSLLPFNWKSLLWGFSVAGKEVPESSCKVAMWPICWPDFNQRWTFLTDFIVKVSNIKFYENPCSWSRSVRRRQTKRRTDCLAPFQANTAPYGDQMSPQRYNLLRPTYKVPDISAGFNHIFIDRSS